MPSSASYDATQETPSRPIGYAVAEHVKHGVEACCLGLATWLVLWAVKSGRFQRRRPKR